MWQIRPPSRASTGAVGAALLLVEAKEEVLAFSVVPRAHWRQI
jgi:hypothetical protein